MQPTYSSSRILLPVRTWFVLLTLIGAFALNLLPSASWPGMPDWAALVLVFWCIREPRLIGMGWGLLLGMLMDVADGAVMGQHALTYVLLAFLAEALARRILWFPFSMQALHVLPLLLVGQLLMLAVRVGVGGDWPAWGYYFSPFVAAFLWKPLTYLLLLPQYQPVERDENRPI